MTQRITLLPLALMLAACAGCSSFEPMPGVTPGAPGGLWVVTNTFPAGAVPSADGPVGQHVRLDGTEATDIQGRTCANPIYHDGDDVEADFLGNSLRSQEYPTLDQRVPVVTVLCDGQPFGVYARWRDDSLMLRLPGMVLRLEREMEPVPAAIAAVPRSEPEPRPQVAIVPPPAPPPAPPAPTAQAMTPLYLASYGSQATAERGWHTLSTDSATLRHLKAEMRPVDLGAKGHFIRLYAQTDSAAQVAQVCHELKHLLPHCGASMWH